MSSCRRREEPATARRRARSIPWRHPPLVDLVSHLPGLRAEAVEKLRYAAGLFSVGPGETHPARDLAMARSGASPDEVRLALAHVRSGVDALESFLLGQPR